MLLFYRNNSVLIFYLKDSGTNSVYLLRNITKFELDLNMFDHPISMNKLVIEFKIKNALEINIENTLNHICKNCYFKYNKNCYNLIGYISKRTDKTIEFSFDLQLTNY